MALLIGSHNEWHMWWHLNSFSPYDIVQFFMFSGQAKKII
jgi:hypothetical protein